MRVERHFQPFLYFHDLLHRYTCYLPLVSPPFFFFSERQFGCVDGQVRILLLALAASKLAHDVPICALAP